MNAGPRRLIWILGLVLMTMGAAGCSESTLGGLPDGGLPTDASPGAPPVALFAPLDTTGLTALTGPNLIQNPGFEAGGASTATNWSAFQSGYAIDQTVVRSETRALRVVNSEGASHGAWQTVTLNQADTRGVYLGAWSRASGVTGDPGADYSIYVDIFYSDGTTLFGQSLPFATGTHDWQYKERVFELPKPIAYLRVYALLRNSKAGTAWFDGITVSEVKANGDILRFDAQAARKLSIGSSGSPGPMPVPMDDNRVQVTSADGLTLTLGAKSGRVLGLSVDDTELAGDGPVPGGIFARDVAAGSPWFHVGGSVVATQTSPAGAMHTAHVEPLGLDIAATYTGQNNRIDVHVEVTDLRKTDRSITLYVALPMAPPAPGATSDIWTWGDDLRGRRASTASSDVELSNQVVDTGIGATGGLSRYPWSALWSESHGIAFAYPLASPRIVRFVFNPLVRLYFAAIDLGISSTSRTPNRITADLVLYRFDSRWGFRAATAGYMERFPDGFRGRMDPRRHGTWIAFADLTKVTGVADFGATVHETGRMEWVGTDDAAGIQTFRYLAEPWSNWVAIADASVDRKDPEQVMAYLRHLWTEGTPTERKTSEATLSSGAFDSQGQYRYEEYPPQTVSWCTNPQGDAGGCVLFLHDSNPSVRESEYPINRAGLAWNEETKGVYTTNPTLDGEYLDSLLSRGNIIDHRPSHWRNSAIPPTFAQGPGFPVGIPLWFGTVQFARSVGQEVHAGGRLLMANLVGRTVPFASDLFDYMGIETNWTLRGHVVPESDEWLSFYRTISGNRPFGLLMNGDFEAVAIDGGVERYFQTALFYGLWPSFFHSFGTNPSPYFANPDWYNRDRPLFRKYIPLIREITTAPAGSNPGQFGWQPVTLATTSDPQVFVERFGGLPTTYFTLRNMRSAPTTVTLSMDATVGGQSSTRLVAPGNLAIMPAQTAGGARTISVALPSLGVEVVKIE